MIDRRQLLAGATAFAAATGCTRAPGPGGGDGGADMARGHRLRRGGFPAPSREEQAGVVIVGGGVAGLSAGWTMAEAGCGDFRLLELEDETGGNARAGRNAVSAFPLGAHYLPVANAEARALRHLLTRLGMIIGEKDGLPMYDPYQLCADLDERLFRQGRWQEGLMPSEGLSPNEAREIARFEAAMVAWRARVGDDGKPAFATPTDYSSADPAICALDRRSFADWLDAEGFLAKPLRDHIRYGCRDDYGSEPETVSAWAGLHYFAGRRGLAADGAGDNQLTWPEGNARLTRLMAARFAGRIAPGRIVFRVNPLPRRRPGPLRESALYPPSGPGLRRGDDVVIDSFDVASGTSVRTRAAAAILAVPRFVAHRIAPQAAPSANGFEYATWLVANVTVDRLPGGRGAGLAWDNVSATSESLGYVVATHQSLDTHRQATVLTWYMPLSTMQPASARRLLIERPADDWRKLIRDDLLLMHPELDGAIRSIDLWRWGHAMARPSPGFLWGTAEAARALDTAPLFSAHSDLGLPLFEEAHYHGVRAAEAAMRTIGHPHESLL